MRSQQAGCMQRKTRTKKLETRNRTYIVRKEQDACSNNPNFNPIHHASRFILGNFVQEVTASLTGNQSDGIEIAREIDCG